MQPGAARCIAAANELLGPNAGRESIRLASFYPSVCWSRLDAELVSARWARAIHPTDAEWRELGALARLAACRQDLLLRDQLLEVAEATSAADALRAAESWASCRIGSLAAIWIQHELGMGATNQGTFHLAQDEFERGLDPCLRSSVQLWHDGRLLGRIYFPAPSGEGKLAPELPRLARLLAPWCQPAEAPPSFPLGEFEERLREAIGEFSAGAGHEINNPLGTILGQARRLLAGTVEADARDSLHKIIDQVGRIRQMIRDLHRIGRRGAPNMEQISLAELVNEAVASVKNPSATLSVYPIPEDVLVRGHRDDLVRLLAEMVTNAIEAAGERGWVRLRASSVVPGATTIVLEDSGPGFSIEARRWATVPFYSGRSAGRGLGMGWAIARRIADDHGIDLVIRPSRPTEVWVTIPHDSVEPAPADEPAPCEATVTRSM